MVRKRVLIIIAVQGIIAIIAAYALIVSITSIQSSRRHAAFDTCNLIRGLVYRATPPKRLAEATSYLDQNGLANCDTYARRVTK